MTEQPVLKRIALAHGEILGYRESGHGSRVIILVHGNMTSSRHFDILMERLPGEFRVFALDLRGFGASTYHTPIDSIKDFSTDLKLFTNALGLKNFTLVGWSLGAGVAMDFAATYPGKAKQLILMESVSASGFMLRSKDTGRQLTTRQQIREDGSMKKLFLAFKKKDRAYMKGFWKKLIYTHAEPGPERFEAYLDDVFSQQNLLDAYFALISFNLTHDHNGISQGTGSIDRIAIPVLVIQGDRDLVNSLDTARANTRAIGENARLKIIKDCGHSPFVDKPDSVVGHILEFLD